MSRPPLRHEVGRAHPRQTREPHPPQAPLGRSGFETMGLYQCAKRALSTRPPETASFVLCEWETDRLKQAPGSSLCLPATRNEPLKPL